MILSEYDIREAAKQFSLSGIILSPEQINKYVGPPLANGSLAYAPDRVHAAKVMYIEDLLRQGKLDIPINIYRSI